MMSGISNNSTSIEQSVLNPSLVVGKCYRSRWRPGPHLRQWNHPDLQKTPSASTRSTLSEIFVLRPNKQTPLWEVKLLIWKNNYINNKVLHFFGPYQLQLLEIDARFSRATFWNMKNKSLPGFAGGASCGTAMRTCIMVCCSIKESKNLNMYWAFFPSSCRVILFFFLMQRYFTYADASSILIWPLEQFIEHRLSKKILVSPELTCWVRRSINPPSKSIKTPEYIKLTL